MLISNIILEKIVSEIKERKYFSLIVDSTSDITTHDQLTIAVWYITKEGKPVERFLGFMSSVGHKGSDMELAILKKFSELNINLKYCRGQSYDNASNISGIYNGLQSRIKSKKMCAIRWSSRYDVCKALFNGYEQVLNALKAIRDDKEQKKRN
ncbi:hypothetical protein QTP88_017858 [Uroleucon formosanum]